MRISSVKQINLFTPYQSQLKKQLNNISFFSSAAAVPIVEYEKALRAP